MKTLKSNIALLLFFILLSSCTFNASLKNLESELGKGDQSSSPTVNLQKIFVDITSITLTEGSVAIINVAVNPIQTTDTVINLNLTTTSSSYVRFNPIPNQIIIPAGSTSKSIVLNTIDDSLLQDQEVWTFSISSPDPSLQADPGTLSITLNDNDGGLIPGGPTTPTPKLLKEFNPYPATAEKLAFNGKVFYVGSDATNGAELWVTDGTANGTRLVKDIEPGSGSSTPGGFYHPPSSPYMFFKATTSSEGLELWVTDGTEQGTHMLTAGFEPGATGSSPLIHLAHADKIYYVSTTLVDGRELYVSDGTNAGTYMLKEANPGSSGHSSVSLLADGSDVYFSLYGPPTYTSALYKTDGTPAGTTLLVNKDASGNDITDSMELEFMFNGRILYSYFDWDTGYELFSTGLTNATTGLVGDFYSGFSSSYATALHRQVVNGKALVTISFDSSGTPKGYYLTDGTSAGTNKITQSVSTSTILGMIGTKLLYRGCINDYDCELYSSQGVSGDAILIKDFYPGATNGNANSGSPSSVAQIGSKIFFTATSDTEGQELWVTDGTTAGTVLLKDINPGTTSSGPGNFTVMGSKLIFTAKAPTSGEEVWITDGTPAGTVIYKDLVPGTGSSGPKNLIALDATQLFFTAYNSLSGFASVFISDTSNYNTTGIPHAMVESLNSETKSMIEFNGLVYFDAQDSSVGMPLWVTNGTSTGTTKITDIYPLSSCSDINNLTVYNGSLFFSASTEANGNEMHISDGTTAGTTLLKDLNGTSTSSGPVAFVKTDTGKMFFVAAHDSVNYGSELYATDGTSAGTGMVKDINPGATGSIVQSLTALPGSNLVIFYSFMLKNFWISNGTSAGTTAIGGLTTVNSSTNAPIPTPTGAFFNYLESSTNKMRIYFYNRTTAVATHLNTTYTTDIVSGFAPVMNPTSGLLYYITNNSAGTSVNLWKSDGTQAGTVLVKNIPSTGTNHQILFIGHIGNNTLFQYGNNSSSPFIRQLWTTDGTSAGTSIIDDATNTVSTSYTAGTTFNGNMYFTRYHATAGVELWKTDGTVAGTSMVKDINSGSANSSFTALTAYNGKLYFVANDGVHGNELWRTDGTLLGTEMVADINPGSGGSNPTAAKVLGGKLYFTAYKVLSGREVWVYSE